MTLPDLHDDLQDLAARLPAPPPSSAGAIQRLVDRRRRRRAAVTLIAVVVALGVGVVAVSSWWPTGPLDPVIEPTPGTDTEFGLASGDDYSVVGALAEVPVDVVGDAPLTVVTANLEAIAANANVQLPVDPGDPEELDRWLRQVVGGPVVPPRPLMPLPPVWQRGVLNPADVQAELGWSWLDVTALVDVGGIHPLGQPAASVPRYTVVTTATDVSLSEGTARLEGDVVQVGPTDGTLDDSSAARLQGQPLFMASLKRHVVAAGREQDVRTWMEGGSSLVDDPALGAVAAFLDEAGAQRSFLGRADFAQPGELAAYDAVGVGHGIVDGQPVMAIAHHFPDADAADQVEGVRATWEAFEWPDGPSQRPLDVFDAGSSGNVAWVRARPTGFAVMGWLETELRSGRGPFAF